MRKSYGKKAPTILAGDAIYCCPSTKTVYNVSGASPGNPVRSKTAIVYCEVNFGGTDEKQPTASYGIRRDTKSSLSSIVKKRDWVCSRRRTKQHSRRSEPSRCLETLPDTEQELIHNFNTLRVIEGFPTMLGSVKWDEGNI